MYPNIGSRLNTNRNHQSGQGFSHSIASDCLSRLEDSEETNFSEKLIRDVSGVMFTGELLSSPRTRTCVSYGWSQAQLIRYAEGVTAPPTTPPIALLILHLDKSGLADFLPSNGSQPRRDGEGTGGT